jgi:class 3 adenylate cyclase/tetratricopeptide (TPR) repeat protein
MPYLPVLLADGVEPGARTVTGSFVSADVSGFTSLSERLARSGRIGAEVLSTSMDQFFTGLIDALTPFGGDVLFFGGDALFVAFLGDDHARRAVDGAIAMLRALRELVPLQTPLGTVRVSMSVGVATGAADLVVGDGPQRPLFLAGPTVSRTVRLESHAGSGEIRVDAVTAEALSETERRAVADDEWVVTTRRPRTSPPQPAPGAIPLRPSPRAERHVPAALRARLLVGDAPKEHRHVTVAFVGIRNLDELTAGDRARVLERASVVVGEACEAVDVSWIETDVVGDGATIVVAGGVPQQRDDDELRVVAAARRILDSELGGLVSIGVHRGTAFVGEIGHERRRTYAVTGLTTITAARLASAAAAGTVLASADVVDRLQYRYHTGPPQELAVKGRSEPVGAATILGLVGGERSSNSTDALVGRRLELATLEEALERHLAGQGAVIDIVGPPGMGKSRLLQAFLAIAPTPRLMVGGELALGIVPFGVLAPALRAATGAAQPSGLRTLVDSLGGLAPLLGPVLGVDVPATDGSRAIEAPSIPAARAELVIRMLREPAGVLVVDDVHWLDPATVELLGAIVDPLASAGWLIVTARRPDTPAITPRAVPLALEPLTDHDVGRLAAAASADHPLSDAQLDAIVHRAGGNPLFAAQLARSTPDTSQSGEVGLPESAERVVGARIDLLPGDLRARLRRTSVLGGRVELDVLQDVIDDPEVKAEEAWAPLDEFVRWSPTRIEFRHDLFRLVAYEGLSFAERSTLHRRAADLLEARPGTPAAVLAEHSRFAGRHADVVRWASQAADEAAAGAAFVDEVRLRRLAADSAKAAGVTGQERTHLYTALAQGHEMLGEVDAAERAYGQALSSATPIERTAIRTRLAWLAFRSDDLTRARRRVSAALRHLPTDAVEVARLRAGLIALRSAIRGAAGDRDRSDADARWVDAEARRLDSDELRGEALMQLAFNADLTDDPDVEELLAAAVPRLERAGRRRDVGILRLNRGVTHMVRGRWPAALASFELAADEFRRCGFVLGSLSTDANRGGLLLEQGHPVVAAELFEEVVRRALAAGNTRKALFATASAHRARAWAGETDTAIEGLVECIQAHRDAGLAAEADAIGAYLVELLVLAGRFEEADREATVVLPHLAAWSSQEVVVLTTRRLAAVARCLTGGPGALDELHEVLAAARADECDIEIARCLQALELCSPVVDPGWAHERAARCTELGVTWMPPVTFVRLDRAA